METKVRLNGARGISTCPCPCPGGPQFPLRTQLTSTNRTFCDFSGCIKYLLPILVLGSPLRAMGPKGRETLLAEPDAKASYAVMGVDVVLSEMFDGGEVKVQQVRA